MFLATPKVIQQIEKTCSREFAAVISPKPTVVKVVITQYKDEIYLSSFELAASPALKTQVPSSRSFHTAT